MRYAMDIPAPVIALIAEGDPHVIPGTATEYTVACKDGDEVGILTWSEYLDRRSPDADEIKTAFVHAILDTGCLSDEAEAFVESFADYLGIPY